MTFCQSSRVWSNIWVNVIISCNICLQKTQILAVCFDTGGKYSEWLILGEKLGKSYNCRSLVLVNVCLLCHFYMVHHLPLTSSLALITLKAFSVSMEEMWRQQSSKRTDGNSSKHELNWSQFSQWFLYNLTCNDKKSTYNNTCWFIRV